MQAKKEDFKKMNREVVCIACDKCCANCSHSESKGTWLKCLIDSKEVNPSGYCHPSV